MRPRHRQPLAGPLGGDGRRPPAHQIHLAQRQPGQEVPRRRRDRQRDRPTDQQLVAQRSSVSARSSRVAPTIRTCGPLPFHGCARNLDGSSRPGHGSAVEQRRSVCAASARPVSRGRAQPGGGGDHGAPLVEQLAIPLAGLHESARSLATPQGRPSVPTTSVRSWARTCSSRSSASVAPCHVQYRGTAAHPSTIAIVTANAAATRILTGIRLTRAVLAGGSPSRARSRASGARTARRFCAGAAGCTRR